MSTQVQLRAANLTDIEWLIGAMRRFYALDEYVFNEGTARPALEKFINDSSLGRLWLVEYEDKTIGYVALTFSYSFEFHGRDAFVDELFIEENYRGQGVGNQVMQFIEAHSREFGIDALHLEVERTNVAALALYKKYGFEDHNRFLMTKWISK
jgi:ribosomal protein S18 acetylase RimI-like enzyme